MDFFPKHETETNSLAIKLAAKVKGGDILLLKGDLGAGKTTFSKYFALALGIKDIITSPTFVILKKYKLPISINNISELIHADCYRLISPEDAYSIGLDEYFERTDVITLIEWPEKIDSIIPNRAKLINFEHIDENSRKISYEF